MNYHYGHWRPVELTALARVREIDGILVSLQCFWINEPVPRYEILVHGHGESGVVDVPANCPVDLDEQMEEAAVCFATTLKLRLINEYWS
jgi:hypothetical protein